LGSGVELAGVAQGKSANAVVYLEGTGEAFGDLLDLSDIVFAKGLRADHFAPWRGSPRLEAVFISGDKEPECY
jgi:hypothetical protein